VRWVFFVDVFVFVLSDLLGIFSTSSHLLIFIISSADSSATTFPVPGGSRLAYRSK